MTRPYIASRSGEALHRRTFDVLVLGGGIAGLTAAIGAARRWRVGLMPRKAASESEHRKIPARQKAMTVMPSHRNRSLIRRTPPRPHPTPARAAR